jgi:serine/threonine-protein kinase HipA
MVDVAEISIWGVPVGAVRWDPQNGLASFQYLEDFLTRGYDLAPLQMPFRNGNRIYSFPELRRTREEYLNTFNGLPG